MTIRRYCAADCIFLAQLFYDTVHTINAKDYSLEQLNAWASGKVDLAAWDQSFLSHYTLVAVEKNIRVGFGDMDDTGYLDRLYVHKDFQRKAVATAICDELERSCAGMQITTHASITAKPFFMKRGYIVIKKQAVERNGVTLDNYIMQK